MRLFAWGSALGLAACQLVAGIKEGSSHGPCTTNSDCPASESCVAAHCQAKGASGAAGSGAKGGGGGTTGGTGGGGKSMGGSSAHAGSGVSAGASGMAQAGATVAQGGDGGSGGSGSGRGGGSGSGGDGGGSDGGEAGAGDTSGTGGRGGSGGDAMGGTGGGGAGAGGAGAGGVAGTTAGTGGGGMAGTGGTGPGPIRIMPLGDGITAGTCMRAFLWKKLTDNAYPAFDFVGSRTAGDTCAPTEYDKNHEGHSGYRVTDLLSATSLHTDSGGDPYTGSSADLALWFDGRPADIVPMVFGSNDLLSTSSTATDVMSAYSQILAKLRSVNSHVTLLVGLLPPMATNKCNTACSTRLSEVNTAIPTWVASANTTDSPVIVVDLNTGFDTANTTDGIKPNDVGAQFLADRWYAAIAAL